MKRARKARRNPVPVEVAESFDRTHDGRGGELTWEWPDGKAIRRANVFVQLLLRHAVPRGDALFMIGHFVPHNHRYTRIVDEASLEAHLDLATGRISGVTDADLRKFGMANWLIAQQMAMRLAEIERDL